MTTEKEEKTRRGVQSCREIAYRIVRRAPEAWEAPGEACYDLIVEGKSGRCVIPDAARSEESARRAAEFFRRHEVRPEEATYVMEDLLAGESLPF